MDALSISNSEEKVSQASTSWLIISPISAECNEDILPCKNVTVRQSPSQVQKSVLILCFHETSVSQRLFRFLDFNPGSAVF